MKLVLTIVACGCLALGMSSTALAQGRGGGGPPGGGGRGGGMGAPGGGGMGGPQFPGGGPGQSGPQFPGERPGMGQPQPQRGPAADGRSGLQVGPAGQRWWDDRSFIKSLKLRPEQQTRMDAIFDQNRNALVSRYDNVQQAEAQMEQLAKSPAPDEAQLFAQIDRVAVARAELEKANTHMLLQLRKEMNPDQVKKLEKSTR